MAPDPTKTADLMPALGLPSEAGRCYLVRRINENVRNPQLREQLIREVEEGGKEFDGRDEKKVYKVHREKSSEGKAMLLLPHAQRRMDERGITVMDLRLALQNWEKWFNREKSMQSPTARRIENDMAYAEPLVWEDKKLRLTVVFKRDAKRNYAVITTYWTGLPDPRPESCTLPDREASMSDNQKIASNIHALADKVARSRDYDQAVRRALKAQGDAAGALNELIMKYNDLLDLMYGERVGDPVDMEGTLSQLEDAVAVIRNSRVHLRR
jgi:hypothetical protein